MPTRINGGSVLAGLGGLLLLVSLFLDWFEPSRTAWTVFEINDLALAALAALTLYAAGRSLRSAAGTRTVPTEGSIVYAGIGALIIVAATLIQHPPAALHSSPQIGAWLALLGAVMITVGGLLVRGRLSIVVTLRPRERTSTIRVAQRPEGTMPTPPPDEPDYEPEYEPDAGYEQEPGYEPEYESEAQ